MITPQISAILLAGGRGQRMGEVDKGLQLLHGKPLVQWVIERIAPQVNTLLVSANRNLDQYRALGFEVLADELPNFPGPLAGLHRTLGILRTPLWLSVPCDTPFLPVDLVQRLCGALQEGGGELAVASVDGHMQPAICLGYAHLRNGLGDFLAGGGRRVGEWQSGLRRVVVPFDNPEMFRNINTQEELARVEAALTAGNG